MRRVFFTHAFCHRSGKKTYWHILDRLITSKICNFFHICINTQQIYDVVVLDSTENRLDCT